MEYKEIFDNYYMYNIKKIISLFGYNFYKPREIKLIPGVIETMEIEHNREHLKGLKSFNSYKTLREDIVRRGMYAPMYIDENKEVMEGWHRLNSLKQTNEDIDLLCLTAPRVPKFLNKEINIYSLSKDKNKIINVESNELYTMCMYTLEIDIYLLTDLRLKMDRLPPASKFFTDKEIFKREMAEYERSKTSRN